MECSPRPIWLTVSQILPRAIQFLSVCHWGDSLLRLKESGSECFKLEKVTVGHSPSAPASHRDTRDIHAYLAVLLFFLRAHLDCKGSLIL